MESNLTTLESLTGNKGQVDMELRLSDRSAIRRNQPTSYRLA